MRDTAREHGVEEHIRFRHRAVRAEWSTADAAWTVDVERTDTGETIAAHLRLPVHVRRLLPLRRGLHARTSTASSASAAQIVHPQHWPEDLDYAGKRVVVIGSGATAVTLVPAMAPEAAHVTMLQRSPSYILAHARTRTRSRTRSAACCPIGAAYPIVRWKNVVAGDPRSTTPASACRATCSRLLRTLVRRQLPAGYAVDTHFKPRYDPWDQRLCLVPNGDLFDGHQRRRRVRWSPTTIETFTESGLSAALGRGAARPT